MSILHLVQRCQDGKGNIRTPPFKYRSWMGLLNDILRTTSYLEHFLTGGRVEVPVHVPEPYSPVTTSSSRTAYTVSFHQVIVFAMAELVEGLPERGEMQTMENMLRHYMGSQVLIEEARPLDVISKFHKLISNVDKPEL